MKIERTFDVDLIRKVCTHPKIWEWISSDDISQESWEPIVDEAVYWLVPIENDEVVGVFMVHPITSLCWEVHTCILPEYWGGSSLNAALKLIEYVFNHTKCEKLITHVPENNKAALKFAIKAGLKEEWINKKSILKNGVKMDQTVLAIYKE